MHTIDLVVPWVDGSDPIWLEEKSRYLKNKKDNSKLYQDWGWMRYWFRCVEKNLPWVRYVFFITYGHLPEWLNVKNPKLKIVNHQDYLLPEFLPTYNSNVISINLHRINELSETFIYVEDDMFFLGKHEPEDFFSADGLPKDTFWLQSLLDLYTGEFAHIMLNNWQTINKYYKLEDIIKDKQELLFSDKYPSNVIEDNKRFSTLKNIPGLKESHMALSFLKSTFLELWKKEPLLFYLTSMHRQRSLTDVSSWLMRDWQVATGCFEPCFNNGRRFATVASDNLEELILADDTKMLCINESDDLEYSSARAQEICSFFAKRFPEKSSFEL